MSTSRKLPSSTHTSLAHQRVNMSTRDNYGKLDYQASDTVISDSVLVMASQMTHWVIMGRWRTLNTGTGNRSTVQSGMPKSKLDLACLCPSLVMGRGWPWGSEGFGEFFKGILIIGQILFQMLYCIERKWSCKYYLNVAKELVWEST